jgi:Tol biopolymer transport system component
MRTLRSSSLSVAGALLLALVVGWGLSVSAKPAEAAFPGSNGKVAFHSNRVTFINPQGDFEVFTMNADGASQFQRTKNGAGDFDPAFSPGGQRIVFESDRDGNAEIYVMTVAGTHKTNRSNNPASDFSPDWQPL